MNRKTRLLISIILGLVLTIGVLSRGTFNFPGASLKDFLHISVFFITLIYSISIFMILSLFNIENKKQKYLYLALTFVIPVGILYFMNGNKIIPSMQTLSTVVPIAGIVAFINNIMVWMKKDSWI